MEKLVLNNEKELFEGSKTKQELINNFESNKKIISDFLDFINHIEYGNIIYLDNISEEVKIREFKNYLEKDSFVYYNIINDVYGKESDVKVLNKLNSRLKRYLVEDNDSFDGLRVYIFGNKIAFGFYGSSGTRINDYLYRLDDIHSAIFSEISGIDKDFTSEIHSDIKKKNELLRKKDYEKYYELDKIVISKISQRFGWNIKKVNLKFSDIINYLEDK